MLIFLKFSFKIFLIYLDASGYAAVHIEVEEHGGLGEHVDGVGYSVTSSDAGPLEREANW